MERELVCCSCSRRCRRCGKSQVGHRPSSWSKQHQLPIWSFDGTTGLQLWIYSHTRFGYLKSILCEIVWFCASTWFCEWVLATEMNICPMMDMFIYMPTHVPCYSWRWWWWGQSPGIEILNSLSLFCHFLRQISGYQHGGHISLVPGG